VRAAVRGKGDEFLLCLYCMQLLVVKHIIGVYKLAGTSAYNLERGAAVHQCITKLPVLLSVCWLP
jgi:hypothetical protein